MSTFSKTQHPNVYGPSMQALRGTDGRDGRDGRDGSMLLYMVSEDIEIFPPEIALDWFLFVTADYVRIGGVQYRMGAVLQVTNLFPPAVIERGFLATQSTHIHVADTDFITRPIEFEHLTVGDLIVASNSVQIGNGVETAHNAKLGDVFVVTHLTPIEVELEDGTTEEVHLVTAEFRMNVQGYRGTAIYSVTESFSTTGYDVQLGDFFINTAPTAVEITGNNIVSSITAQTGDVIWARELTSDGKFLLVKNGNLQGPRGTAIYNVASDFSVSTLGDLRQGDFIINTGVTSVQSRVGFYGTVILQPGGVAIIGAKRSDGLWPITATGNIRGTKGTSIYSPTTDFTASSLNGIAVGDFILNAQNHTLRAVSGFSGNGSIEPGEIVHVDSYYAGLFNLVSTGNLQGPRANKITVVDGSFNKSSYPDLIVNDIFINGATSNISVSGFYESLTMAPGDVATVTDHGDLQWRIIKTGNIRGVAGSSIYAIDWNFERSWFNPPIQQGSIIINTGTTTRYATVGFTGNTTLEPGDVRGVDAANNYQLFNIGNIRGTPGLGHNIFAFTHNFTLDDFQAYKIQLGDLIINTGSSVISGDPTKFSGYNTLAIGDVRRISSVDTSLYIYGLEQAGNIRGSPGQTGGTGPPGQTGPTGPRGQNFFSVNTDFGAGSFPTLQQNDLIMNASPETVIAGSGFSGVTTLQSGWIMRVQSQNQGLWPLQFYGSMKGPSGKAEKLPELWTPHFINALSPTDPINVTATQLLEEDTNHWGIALQIELANVNVAAGQSLTVAKNILPQFNPSLLNTNLSVRDIFGSVRVWPMAGDMYTSTLNPSRIYDPASPHTTLGIVTVHAVHNPFEFGNFNNTMNVQISIEAKSAVSLVSLTCDVYIRLQLKMVLP